MYWIGMAIGSIIGLFIVTAITGVLASGLNGRIMRAVGLTCVGAIIMIFLSGVSTGSIAAPDYRQAPMILAAMPFVAAWFAWRDDDNE